MRMRGAVTRCLVVLCVVVLLAEQAEGHITFFTPQQMREMKLKAGRKVVEPRSEEGFFEEVSVQPVMEENGEALRKAIEIGVKLTPQQLEYVAPVLGEIFQEILDEAERAK